MNLLLDVVVVVLGLLIRTITLLFLLVWFTGVIVIVAFLCLRKTFSSTPP